MRNIRLTIEYDGTNYAGWQCQKSQIPNPKSQIKTIQETLEKTLRKILQEKIKLIASGRTDAGVHALAQVANFHTKADISVAKMQQALNALLPNDIAVTKAQEAKLDFHARFNVKSKLYRYAILNSHFRSAFLKDKAYFYRYPLDTKLMRKASRFLLGKHDFKAFCASASSAKDTERTIKNITIKKLLYPLYAKRYPLVIIDIKAEGFLYNMARNIVGTLIEVGRGKLKKGEVRKILLSKDRRLAGPTAPAGGLYLIRVNY